MTYNTTTGSNLQRCIKQDSETNTLPTSYSGPLLTLKLLSSSVTLNLFHFPRLWTRFSRPHDFPCPWPKTQSLELLMKKKRTFLGGSGGMPPHPLPPPPKTFESQDQKLCNLRYSGGYLKKCSTLKFIMNISFVPSIWIHRSIILIFIGKKVCLSIFFPRKIYFSAIFYFHFRDNPCSRDEFKALKKHPVPFPHTQTALPFLHTQSVSLSKTVVEVFSIS